MDDDISYYVTKTNGRWSVIENQTALVVDSFDEKSNALEYCDFLNEGGGFDGFTPTFMLHQIVTEDYVFSVED